VSAARPIAPALAAAFVALAIAGCGGGASPGVASLGGTHHGHSGSTAPAGGGGPGTFIEHSSSSSGPGGGSSSSFVMAGGARSQLLELSRCMRSHGVPSFPDPSASGVIQGSGLDPNSPQFERAMKSCAKYTPKGRSHFTPAEKQKLLAQLLRYSRCMRSHGVPAFPDPTSSGNGVGLQIQGGPNNGLDPGSPIFQRASRACSSLPGAPQVKALPRPGGGP